MLPSAWTSFGCARGASFGSRDPIADITLAAAEPGSLAVSCASSPARMVSPPLLNWLESSSNCNQDGFFGTAAYAWVTGGRGEYSASRSATLRVPVYAVVLEIVRKSRKSIESGKFIPAGSAQITSCQPFQVTVVGYSVVSVPFTSM